MLLRGRLVVASLIGGLVVDGFVIRARFCADFAGIGVVVLCA